MYLDTRVEGLGEAQMLYGEEVDQEAGGIRSSQVVDQVVVRILLYPVKVVLLNLMAAGASKAQSAYLTRSRSFADGHL